MNLRRPALAVAFLAAAPAAATEVTGEADVGYSRSETWSRVGYQRSIPYDFGGELTATGSALAPGLADWLLSGNYRNLHTLDVGANSRTNSFGFRGQASLLGGTALPTTFFASRGWSDFSTDLAATRTGSTLATTVGGATSLRVPDFPVLRANLQRTLVDNHAITGEDSRSYSTLLGAGLDYSAGRNSVSVNYGTGWNTGSLAQSDYRSHTANLQMSSLLTEEVRVALFDQYYLRLPGSDAPTNPRYDDNTLGGSLEVRATDKVDDLLTYAQHRQLVRVPGAEEREQTSYAATDRVRYRWSTELDTFATGNFGYTRARLDGSELRSTTGTGGAGANWHKQFGRLVLGAGAAGNAGVVKVINDGSGLAWGASGSTLAGWSAGGGRAQANWSISYQRGGTALRSESLDQQVLLLGERLLAGSRYLRGNLSVALSRRSDELFGTSRTRTASLLVELLWAGQGLHLNAGATDGLSERLAPAPLAPLPQTFNTTTLYATLSATQALGRWTLTELVRTLSIRDPSRGRQYEHGLGITAAYTIGLVTLTFEDRFTVGGGDGTRTVSNFVIGRIGRSFGATF